MPAQVAQTRLVGLKVQMNAAPGLLQGEGERPQGGSPPARCQMDPAESCTVPARKLSFPVIWETWRQRGRGGSLGPIPPSRLRSGLRRSRCAGGGALQVADAKYLPPGRGLGCSPGSVRLGVDFPSSGGTCHPCLLPAPALKAYWGLGWGVSPGELEGQPLAFLFSASARGAGVRLGSVQDE